MINATTIVSDIVRERPGLAPLFEQLNIDYCCGGNRPLAEACEERGLEPETVATLLNASLDQQAQPEERVDALSDAELVEHIVTTHHVYLRRELPRIVQIAEKVASGHSDKEPRLVEVAVICKTLATNLLRHADGEEGELFPAILEGNAAPDVSRYVADHEAVGAQLARIRELPDGHVAPLAQNLLPTSSTSVAGSQWPC